VSLGFSLRCVLIAARRLNVSAGVSLGCPVIAQGVGIAGPSLGLALTDSPRLVAGLLPQGALSVSLGFSLGCVLIVLGSVRPWTSP